MWQRLSCVALLAVLAALSRAQPQPQPPYNPGGPGYGPTSYPPPYGQQPYGQNQPYGSQQPGAFGAPSYAGGSDQFRPVYEWSVLDYAWPDDNLRASALRTNQYNPSNNVLYNAKVWRDRMFLAVPRLKEGVPATLSSVPAQSRGGSLSPRLEPFPSWGWNEPGNCSSLQNVQAIEVDTQGRLWVADSGRINTRGNLETRCPAKIVIFDLNSATFADNYYNNGYSHGGSQYPGPGGILNTNDPYRRDQYSSDNYNDPNRRYQDPNYPSGSHGSYPGSSYPGDHRPGDPNYRPNDPNYRPNDPNYRSSDPNYRPNDPNYRSNDPNYRSNDPNYRPGDLNYRSNDPNYRSNDPNYRPNDPNYRSDLGGGYGSQYGGYRPGFGSSNPLYNDRIPSRIRVIKSYTFGEEVVDGKHASLTSMVIDDSNGWYAYIADSSDADPGIVVFNLRESRAWKARDPRSMRADHTADSVTINNDRVDLTVHVASLALSPPGMDRTLYYSPLSSRSLYSLPTKELREHGRDVTASVNNLGQKLGLSDGMIMDNNGVLYLGNLNENGISRWDSHRDPFSQGQRNIARDPHQLQWPAAFAFDGMGGLLVVSNRFQKFLRNQLGMTGEPTYRIMRASLNVQSYQLPPGQSGTYGSGYSRGITGRNYDDPIRDGINRQQPSSFDRNPYEYDNRYGYAGRYNMASSFVALPALTAVVVVLATLVVPRRLR